MKAWNSPPGAREQAKARGKVLASNLASAVKKQRATAAVKHKAGRKIGPR